MKTKDTDSLIKSEGLESGECKKPDHFKLATNFAITFTMIAQTIKGKT